MSNPRIISGKYKNQTLEVPSSARPITDRVKQVLFDTIQQVIVDSKVADLFAGSGNIGIEALSRGAKSVVLVENDERAVEVIKDNLSKLRITDDPARNASHSDAGGKLQIIKQSYSAFCDSYEEKFDLIFLDPPFEKVLTTDLSKLVRILASGAYVVIKVATEDMNEFQVPESFKLVLEKKVGSNTLVFLQKSLV
ncbi:16S rRNA (guanine(966)-N(2))-methyltransferase RsmD [Candidatus Dojkabacteria bacterium]|uniref:16S rRNA (Guanine(966)-N(2))-methyltransferase RsmD n=1 Tax=Candidatus Dojkabacteria bacterium TaxID=2099670 RepID=A0A955I9Z9_9BACT|nr:16S rRNA (guanine(966)-N(2))-methyltransferase RsmD [Candidatus Dojkabacteria bacterium]